MMRRKADTNLFQSRSRACKKCGGTLLRIVDYRLSCDRCGPQSGVRGARMAERDEFGPEWTAEECLRRAGV